MSSIVPAPSGPGLARALPSVGLSAQTGPALKAEAIRLQPLTGMSKRECWKNYEGGTRGWTTIQRYFDADYPKSYPTPRFVQWLRLRAQMATIESAAREFEVGVR